MQKLGKKGVVFDPDKSIIYTLNETALYIFNYLKRGLSKEEVLEKLIRKYEVEKSSAENDLSHVIKMLLNSKIITRTN